MPKTIKVGITFEFYPDEDELMRDSELTEEELIEYYKTAYVEDIYNFVKYNELYEAVEVEVVNE